MSTARKPAITRTVGHPADTIPERTAVVVEPNQPKLSASSNPPVRGGERLTEQHNVRIRSSVKERLGRAVDKLRYETGDRSISIASITDQALDAYLQERGC